MRTLDDAIASRSAQSQARIKEMTDEMVLEVGLQLMREELQLSQKALAEALTALQGAPVELTIIEDDNPAVRTPLEWRQAIYEEKLAQAREAIIADNNIQTLRRFFDADLDEESIRPL